MCEERLYYVPGQYALYAVGELKANISLIHAGDDRNVPSTTRRISILILAEITYIRKLYFKIGRAHV